jgi:hypothetical protein
MALVLHINNTKRAPSFHGDDYAKWKLKMKSHLKSINGEVWNVTETKYEIVEGAVPTPAEEKKQQANDVAVSAFHEALDDKAFELINNTEVAHDIWKKLEEAYEGTESVKTARAYMLQERFASFSMKEDESVSEMFHRL